MPNSKRSSLPRIDNNYQINLRYPDINDFLKDTSFELLDNQTAQMSRISNVQALYSTTKTNRQIMINSQTTDVKLSELTIFAYAEDQELFYDFLVVPSMFGVPLTTFVANRANTQGAFLQSVVNYAAPGLREATNFNIQISSERIAALLTDALHRKLNDILAVLSAAAIENPYQYFKDNLISLILDLSFSYRLNEQDTYDTAFTVQAKFEYLAEGLSPQQIFSSANVLFPAYDKASTSVALSLTGKSLRAGSLQFSYVDANNSIVSPIKNDVSQDQVFVISESAGLAKYTASSVGSLYVTQPTLQYRYYFKPANTIVTYSGSFVEKKLVNTLQAKPTIKLNNYICFYEKLDSGKYNVTLKFQTEIISPYDLAQLLPLLGDNTKAPIQLGYKLQLEEFVTPETKRSIELDTASGQLLVAGSFNESTNAVTYAAASKTSTHSSTFSTAKLFDNNVNFKKITTRVSNALQNSASYSSTNLSNFTADVTTSQFTGNTDTTIKKSECTIKWTNLTTTELAALYMLTTAQLIYFGYTDLFHNVLSQTAFTSTTNVLSRNESPFINPETFLFYGQFNQSTGTIAKTSIPATVLSTILNVPNQLKLITSPNLTFDTNSFPRNKGFSFTNKLICLVEYGKISNGAPAYSFSTLKATLVEGTHYTVVNNEKEQIASIQITPVQKANIVDLLKISPTQLYRLCILLPLNFVRTYKVNNVDKHLVRVALSNVNNAFTYEYIWRIP